MDLMDFPWPWFPVALILWEMFVSLGNIKKNPQKSEEIKKNKKKKALEANPVKGQEFSIVSETENILNYPGYIQQINSHSWPWNYLIFH